MFFRRPRKPSVLLTEIGNRNTGDEALYAAALRRFAAMGLDVGLLYRVRPRDDVLAIGAASLTELRVEDRFDDIRDPETLCAEFRRRHPAAWQTTKKLVKAHDLVAIAPGGRFTDGYNNPRALLTAAVALHEGVPLVNLHQSFGPLDAEDHRDLLLAVLKRARLTIVRDACSHEFLLRAGLAAERMVMSRDATFAEPFPEPPEPAYDVGFNVRHGFNGRVNPGVLRLALETLQQTRPGLRMLVYSTTHALDEQIQRAVAGRATTWTEVPSWSDRAQAPGSCRVNVSDSFHGMIFSMLAGRATLCCRTDFATWKMEGTAVPGESPMEMLPGLTAPADVPLLVERTLAALDAPASLLARQTRLIDHARTLAEAGWRHLEAVTGELRDRNTSR